MGKGRRITLLISLGITALTLATTMICFFNLEKLADVSQNIFGYGLLLVLTLCKPVLIAYVVLAALYVVFGLLIAFRKMEKGSVKLLLFFSAALAPLALVTQVPLWAIAFRSGVLIAVTLISEILSVINFYILKGAYYALYPKRKKKKQN